MRDRAFARRLACLHRRSLIGLAGLTLLLFSGCDQPIVAPRARQTGHQRRRAARSRDLVHRARTGKRPGFDHDLLTRFARERGVPLNVVFADGAAALLSKIGSGEAQLGAGGLFAAASRKRGRRRRRKPRAGLEQRLPRGRAGPDLQRRRLPAAPLGRSRQGDRRLPCAHRPRHATRRRAARASRRALETGRRRRPPTR